MSVCHVSFIILKQITKENYSDGIKEIRTKRNATKKMLPQEIRLQQFGPEIASELFNKLISPLQKI